MWKKYSIIVVLVSLILLISLKADRFYSVDKIVNELRAFPTAEGGGMYTVGGRGGSVIEVTNLNSEGVGSLREACKTKGTRTIVFRIGGTIDLEGESILITEDNLTIAGQSAPGDGIQIKNGGIIVSASEVIIRYIRIRAGAAHSNVDALDIASPSRHDRKKNIIIDHTSLFWGVDETLDAGAFNDDVTVQWSIIAEGLHNSIHKEGKHSRGVMITEQSRNITLHHNLIYRNYKRNPLIQSSDVNIVNNVIVNYQYQVFVQPFKGRVHANFIGNYFRSSIHKRAPIRVFDNNRGYDSQSGVYYKDNYDAVFRANSTKPETAIRVLAFTKNSKDKDGHVQDVNQSYIFTKVKIDPVQKAYDMVLNNVGTSYPKRDAADERVIAFVRSGKAPMSFVNAPKEVGGYPKILNGKAPIDTDHDGMPDSWEKRHGLNPKNAEDRNGKVLNNVGYTNLEMYLNGLVKNNK
jgi:pectate lyase